MPERIVSSPMAHPRATLSGWALLMLAAGVGALWLEVDTSTDSILDREDPAYAYHRHSQELFGGEEILVVAIVSEEPWGFEALSEVVRLSTHFEDMDKIRRVDSLASVPLIEVAAGGELLLDPPLGKGVPESAEARRLLGIKILADRIAPRNLVSDDGRVFALNLLLEAGTRDGFLEMVEAVRGQVDAEHAWISGVPVFRTEINTQTRKELLTFVPLTIVLMAGLLYFVFRSAYAIALSLAPGSMGAIVMLGVMGATGASITLISMILPSIVLALGCAYAMHMLAAAQGAESPTELRETLVRVSLPVALSGLTTAIGFASIGIVRIDAVREAGAYGALGVLATLAATLTVLPASLALRKLSPLRPRFADLLEGRISTGLTELVVNARGRVLLVWLLLLLPLCLGLTRLDAATDATSWFPEGTRPRDEYDKIRGALAGISPVNVVIESRDGGLVTDPEVVAAIDRLATYLEARSDVGKAISIADPLRQIHAGFSEGSASDLPESRALIEQYLLLLESVDSIHDVLTEDRRAANVVLRVDDNRSGTLREVAADAEAWWLQHGVRGFVARGTGTMFEFARAEDEITFGQIRGLTIAVLVIGLVLWLVFRRLNLALMALIPNVLPVLAIFGFMGLAGIALDAGTVMVGSLALGIAVDDTMHMVTSLHKANEAGATGEQALLAALQTNLPALTYTTAIIAVGFGVLGLSDFTYIRNLGLLIMGIMGVCLAADVNLLPALLGARRDRTVAESS